MNKKTIFAVVIFVVLGLFMYTFANPLEDDISESSANANPSNEVTEDTKEEVTTPVVDNSAQPAVSENTARGVLQTRPTVPPTPAPTPGNNEPVAPVVPTPGNDEKPTPAPAPTPGNDEQPKPVVPTPGDDEKPKPTPAPVDTLAKDREKAKKEIKEYAEKLKLETDYSDILDEANKKIDEATTKEEITKVVEDTKKALDDIKNKEELDKYKEDAKKEIKEYAESLELETDYSNILDEANKKIDEATTKEDVDKIVEETKKTLDDLKKKEEEEKRLEELNKYKEDAKKEIDEYKKADEEYIDGIRPIKEDAFEDIEKAESIDAIKDIVEDTKDKIDELINNTEFSVKFYGIQNKLLATKTVKYGTSVERPDTSKDIKEWNNSIVLRFKNWNVSDEELNSVKKDLEVRAYYNVISATTKISILKEGLGKDYSVDINDFNHPVNGYLKLEITKEIEEAINNYNGEHIFVYFYKDADYDVNAKIRSVVNNIPDVYGNNKYKKIEYYVLKLQGDRFHCDGRIRYDYDSELADAKEAAIKEIKDYKKEEEKDISEITTIKNETIEKITNAQNVDDVKKELADGKKAIDDLLDKKTFKVTFVGKNGVTKVEEVKYLKNAKAPNTKDFTEPTYKNVVYKLSGWDKEFKKVTSDITVNAQYRVHKIYATVTLTNAAVAKQYETIELKDSEKILSVINADVDGVVYTTDAEIRSVDKSNKLPSKDGKYKEYKFSELKFTGNGFVITGTLYYDKAQEELDNLKAELQRLIDSAKKLDTTNKTVDSVNKLNSDIAKAEVNVKGNDVNAIKESINDLKNINLVDKYIVSISVVNNKEVYFKNELNPDLTVTATYNDRTTKVLSASDYSVKKFITTSSGKNKKATVVLNANSKITAEFRYSVDSKTYDEYIDGINNKKIDGISISVANKKIKFNNLPEDVKVDSVIKIYTVLGIQIDQVQINLIKTSEPNVFSLSQSDYEKLRETNTVLAGQYIKIVYSVSGRTYSRNYMEFLGDVF